MMIDGLSTGNRYKSTLMEYQSNCFEELRAKSRRKIAQLEYSDQPFTFDEDFYQVRQSLQQFPKFQKDYRGELLSKSLIEENQDLKKRLRESEHVIHELETQLSFCRKQISKSEQDLLQEREYFERKITGLRKQIFAIMESNQMVERQIASLNIMLPRNQLSKKTKSKTKSLERFAYKENRPLLNISSLQTQQGKKVEDLMESIRNMHLKIMGFSVEGLKDLWRWLKNIALVYSSLRKWKDKYVGLNAHWRNDKLREAVYEIFQLLA